MEKLGVTLTKLELIDSSFNKLEEQKQRFLKCERAYKAKYSSEHLGRTKKLKASSRKRSKLYVPLIKTTVNIIHAIFKTSFMGKRNPIEIQRVGKRNPSDMIKANAIKAALKKEWEKGEHRIGLSKAVLSAIYLPMGITTLFWDENRKQIRTTFVPITNLAFDELARDIFDIEHVCYKWNQSVRDVKRKFDTKFYKGKKDRIYSKDSNFGDRIEMKEIYQRDYEKDKLVWRLSTYAGDIFVREDMFKNLPFHFGYCLEDVPSVDIEKRKEELNVYGSSLPEITWEIQEEYNIKRNQKIDITENQIDPQLAIDKNSGSVAVGDIVERRKMVRFETVQGKGIRDVVMPLGEPGTYGLTEEIQMLKSEYEVTTGVNSILTGQTSASDRRAMGALQTVNASSSMRIESMMQTLQDTMLNSYAKSFVELLWEHTSDEDFIKFTENEDIIDVIGTQGRREPLDFDIKINFGTTIANETRLNQLNQLLQILLQSGQGGEYAQRIIQEIMILLDGENAPIESINKNKEAQNEPTLEEKEASALMSGGV